MTWAFVNPTSGYRTFSRLVSLSTRSLILTSTAVSLATFAHHLARRLVRAQALERGSSQLARFRPFHELELCHEFRLHEMRRSWRGADVKGAPVLLEGLQQRGQLLQHRIGEPGSDLACVHKPPLVEIADQQRA